jgi:hypothetical protein
MELVGVDWIHLAQKYAPVVHASGNANEPSAFIKGRELFDWAYYQLLKHDSAA